MKRFEVLSINKVVGYVDAISREQANSSTAVAVITEVCDLDGDRLTIGKEICDIHE